jgi:beta-lactamase superfamily II metal-dependent hydrolase
MLILSTGAPVLGPLLNKLVDKIERTGNLIAGHITDITTFTRQKNDEVKRSQSTHTDENSVVPEKDINIESQKPKVVVHFIDVGQGDAILVQANGHNMLIDAGDKSAGKRVAQYLKDHNAQDLDYLIGTHLHADHIGGIPALVREGIRFRHYIAPSQECYTNTCIMVSRITENKRLNVTRGQTLEFPVKVLVLNPTEPLEFTNKNDNSIVLYVDVNDVEFLLTGDCERDCEYSIIDSGLLGQAEVLKVGHHGSISSTSEKLLNWIDAELAVISAGAGNRYGHPHKEILERLKRFKLRIYRTDLQGDIVIITDGTTYKVVTPNAS